MNLSNPNQAAFGRFFLSVNPEFAANDFHVGNGGRVVAFGVYPTVFDLVERLGLYPGGRFQVWLTSGEEKQNKYVSHGSSHKGEAIVVPNRFEYKPPVVE